MKFKPGDRVKHIISGATGIVISVETNTPDSTAPNFILIFPLVKWDDDDAQCLVYERFLRILESETKELYESAWDELEKFNK